MRLLSVVIPMFDRVALVADAVASAAAQREVDCEVIVVDDGSSADTTEVRRLLHDVGGRFVRIEHAGVAAARNAGIDAARGDCIAFLDSDDLFYPHKLAAQIEAMERAGLAWSCCGYDVVAPNGEIVERTSLAGVRPDFWKFSCPIGATALVARRDVLADLGGFDTAFDVCEDWDLVIRLGKASDAAIVPHSLYAYRTGCGNITATRPERWFAGWDQLSRKHGIALSVAAYPFLAKLAPQIEEIAARRCA